MAASRSSLRRAIDAAWPRRWDWAVPVATCVALGSLYAVHLRDTFKATAHVDVSQVVATGGSGGIPQASERRTEQVVATARDALLADEHVAAAVAVLRPGADSSDPVAVAKAKSRIAFDQVGDAAFTVSVTDADGELAARAVNAMLDSFLAKERATRLGSAAAQRDFLKAELEKAEKALDDAQTAVTQFRAEHEDALPESKDVLTAELSRLESEVRDRESQATSARRLMQDYDRMIRQTPVGSSTPSAPSAEETQLTLALTGQQKSLDDAQRQLVELRGKYQDKWPAIVSLKEEIRSMEERVASTKGDLEAAHRRSEEAASARRTTETQGVVDALKTSRDSAAEDERRANEAADRARGRLEVLRARLSKVPSTSSGLAALVARVDQAQKQVDSVRSAERTARQSAEAYQTEVGATGFDVKSRAAAPALPSGPPRRTIVLGSLVVGLLIGYGATLLRRRFADEPLARPEDVAALLPGALVVGVPLLGAPRSAASEGRHDALMTAWVVACVVATVLALGSYEGVLSAPEWFRPWLRAA